MTRFALLALAALAAAGCDSATDPVGVANALSVETPRRVVITALGGDGTGADPVPGLAFDLRNESTATLSTITVRLRTEAGVGTSESVGVLRAFLDPGARASIPVPAVQLELPDFRCYSYTIDYVAQPRKGSATRERMLGGTCTT